MGDERLHLAVQVPLLLRHSKDLRGSQVKLAEKFKKRTYLLKASAVSLDARRGPLLGRAHSAILSMRIQCYALIVMSHSVNAMLAFAPIPDNMHIIVSLGVDIF